LHFSSKDSDKKYPAETGDVMPNAEGTGYFYSENVDLDKDGRIRIDLGNIPKVSDL
jgi:hypothetical protein